jgi:O-methyltransferase domain/Dimerisation domain
MNPESMPPQARIRQLVGGFGTTRAIHAAVRLGLPDLMAKEVRTADEIAAEAGCDADAVFRLLRALASLGLCVHAGDRRFEITPLGETLRADAPNSMRAMVLHMSEMMAELWTHLPDCVRTGKTARRLLSRGEDFGFLEADPQAAAEFNSAMAQNTRAIAGAVVAAYDFSAIHRLIDVGGGYGPLLLTILKANPKMRGVVLDLEHAAEGARREIAAAGLADRCEFGVGDFFKEVPAGADAYILKSIIHDWDDERAIAILRNCRRAAASGAKVLLVELVVPEQMGTSPQDQATAMLDLNMLVGPGGRERTEAEFRRIFEAAGLRLVRVVPSASGSAVIEGAPA